MASRILEHASADADRPLFNQLSTRWSGLGRTVVRDGGVVEDAPCLMQLLSVETRR